jgi:16S rRNA (cytidine1402-2'-O)-methyltransferase
MINVATLYVVATPIGNLGDITLRAVEVLKEVQLIAAEDTRQSKKLLTHYGISTPLMALHAHNERERAVNVLDVLNAGQSVAYITDAGTPLISDPGAQLVQIVRENGFAIVPIPGPCAAIAALSVAGLKDPNFYFEGFLPNKSSARKQRLSELKAFHCALIFYESPHRILKSLADMLEVLGNRRAVVARELTKKFETVLEDSVQNLLDLITSDSKQQLGEFVVIVSGQARPENIQDEKIEQTLQVLLQELPLKKAVAVAAQLLNVGRNELYQQAITLKNSINDEPML